MCFHTMCALSGLELLLENFILSLPLQWGQEAVIEMLLSSQNVTSLTEELNFQFNSTSLKLKTSHSINYWEALKYVWTKLGM